MASEPQNFKAIKAWFEKNRPDIPKHQMDAILENDAIILIAAGSFEAGREFQRNNPEAGQFLDPFTEYK